MSKFVLGIDLGANGGFALLNSNKELVKFAPMPKHPVDGGIDHYEVEGFFASVKGAIGKNELVVATEKLHSIYGSSASSNYTFGSNNGYVNGLIHVWFGRDTKRIIARRWQKFLFELCNTEETKRKDGKRDTKSMAREAIESLYPDEDLKKSNRHKYSHDGTVDAIGIALYVLNGGE